MQKKKKNHMIGLPGCLFLVSIRIDRLSDMDLIMTHEVIYNSLDGWNDGSCRSVNY